MKAFVVQEMKKIVVHDIDRDNQKEIYDKKCSKTQKILRIRRDNHSRRQIDNDVNVFSNLSHLQRIEVEISTWSNQIYEEYYNERVSTEVKWQEENMMKHWQ